MNWDPSFFRKSPLFWPVAHAAASLEAFQQWPTPEQLNALFGEACGMRFEHAKPKPRRARLSGGERYDARIALEGVVPTRARSWHDLLNTLVWASFPNAKRALHARQHRMIAARLGADLRLPGARTKEQDAVAMLDEGGVVVLRAADGRERRVIFGHAIYEGLVCGGPEGVRAAAYVAPVDTIDEQARERADAALAELLTQGAEITREYFGSVVVDERLA